MITRKDIFKPKDKNLRFAFVMHTKSFLRNKWVIPLLLEPILKIRMNLRTLPSVLEMLTVTS